MQVKIFENDKSVNIELHPENIEEISLLGRLSMNCKPDGVEFVTYFNRSSIDSNIHFTFFKNKRSTVRNTRK